MRVFSPSIPERLKRGDLVFLVVLALVVYLAVASLQTVPGYMDAAYYYATGTELAVGNGFSEPFIWNYLDHPQSLPHPSHAYWYPLASLVSAAGMVFFGRAEFWAARAGFIFFAILFPAVVALLAMRLTGKRALAITSGLLAIFCGYYLPFIVTTDHYAIYLLVGAVLFLNFKAGNGPLTFLLGILTGILNLGRGDGLLWLPMLAFSVGWLAWRGVAGKERRKRMVAGLLAGGLVLCGYLVVMAPWLLRNLTVFGSMTPPGSAYVLWMTEYNQLYSFHPEEITFAAWAGRGWSAIVGAGLTALWRNLGTAMLAQGMILGLPLILLGIWKLRKEATVLLAVGGWLVLILVESLIFPYASVNGGFFHAGAAFQPMWFVMAPLGLEVVLDGLDKLWKVKYPRWPIRVLFIAIMAAISVMLVKVRVVDTGWNEGEPRYLLSEGVLAEAGADDDAIVMTTNPPAYYAMTGRQAIVIPSGTMEDLLAAAHQFGAEYLVLEANRLLETTTIIYEDPLGQDDFEFVGGFEDVRIFRIVPAP